MIAERYKVDDKPLMPLNSKEIPSYFLFLDIESMQCYDEDIEVHTFDIAWTCLWNRKQKDKKKQYTWHYFRDGETMLNYIASTVAKLGKLTLLGHNVYFDLQASGFFSYFTEKKWVLDFVYDKGSTFILKCTKQKQSITALSTTNWFSFSLKELGKLVGLKKMDINLNECSINDLKRYCKRDVEIIVNSVRYYIEFIQKNNFGKFSYTKASQAFNTYRYRFLEEKIRIHKDETVVNLERQAYMGGRTECFWLGKVPGNNFVTLDINSMYPYVMKNYDMPVQLSDYYNTPSIDDLVRVIDRFMVIAEVTVKTQKPAYAIHYNGKTVFPIGEFTCFLCTEGIKYALENEHITGVRQMAIYKKGRPFKSYVDKLFSVRKKYKNENNKVMEKLSKFMANSLYGKWGQKYQVEEKQAKDGVHDYYKEEILDFTTGSWITKTHLMNRIITKTDEVEGRLAFVAICAHITEAARMLLWSMIEKVGTDKVLYCDTDCIKIRKKHMYLIENEIDSNILGKLKLEDESKELTICGNKFYVTEKETKLKGIPRDAIEIAKDHYRFRVWPKMTYHLRNGIITGYHRNVVERKVKIAYDKGIVLNSGRIIPFTFPLVE
jgi:hypothetical protein